MQERIQRFKDFVASTALKLDKLKAYLAYEHLQLQFNGKRSLDVWG